MEYIWKAFLMLLKSPLRNAHLTGSLSSFNGSQVTLLSSSSWHPRPAHELLLTVSILPCSPRITRLSKLNVYRSWVTAAETMSCTFFPARYSWKTFPVSAFKTQLKHTSSMMLCWPLPAPHSQALTLRTDHSLPFPVFSVFHLATEQTADPFVFLKSFVRL